MVTLFEAQPAVTGSPSRAMEEETRVVGVSLGEEGECRGV
jgi:hypothetical protein